MKKFSFFLLGALVIIVVFWKKPTSPMVPSVGKEPTPTSSDTRQISREVVMEGLNIPWEIVFLPASPGGEMLITERPGNLLLVGKDRRKIAVQGVVHKGEGGLLGLAVHPKFPENHFVYLYLTYRRDSGLMNRVERYKLEGDQLSERLVVLDGILGSSNHDGGRIAFGPDYYLYIGTGDAENQKLAQDTKSLNGKILRVTEDGAMPSGNPFGNAVYSYGHRNVQGLAWDEKGQLWATEHGPSGLQTGFDELNRIEKGKNYGWPDRADRQKEGTEKPVVHSGEDTWAPSGAVFYNDSVLFAGLAGEAIYQYKISSSQLTTHFKGEFGRIRMITRGPDGQFYILTNNTDGRGNPKDGDDKLIRLGAGFFE